MGWYGFANTENIKRNEIKDFLDKTFTGTNKHEEDGKLVNFKDTILESSLVGNVYYAATEREDFINNKKFIWAAINLISKSASEQLMYRPYSEFDRPLHYGCPKKILDLLSPTDNEYALEWRAKCYEQIEKKKADRQNPCNIKNLKEGDRVFWTPTLEGWTGGIEAGKTYTLEKFIPWGKKQARWWVMGLDCMVKPSDIPLNELKEFKEDKQDGVRQKLLTAEILNKVPGLYGQDDKGHEAIAYAKFFTPNSLWTWYMTEYNPETKEAFGWVEGLDNELGYFSVNEFIEMNKRFKEAPKIDKVWVERDKYFKPTALKDIPSYREAFNLKDDNIKHDSLTENKGLSGQSVNKQVDKKL